MKKIRVAFDVDGTLIDIFGRPRYEVIDYLKSCIKLGMEVFVWSGGGMEYAENRTRSLALDEFIFIAQKGSFVPDIVIDDEEVRLGLVNIKV